jgi:hypothetical protein
MPISNFLTTTFPLRGRGPSKIEFRSRAEKTPAVANERKPERGLFEIFEGPLPRKGNSRLERKNRRNETG